MKLIFFLLPLFIVSCATKLPLQSGDEINLLKKTKITGLGKCRLTILQQQDLFSCEALMQNLNTWLLSISVPLRGEELMILPGLDHEILHKKILDDFEFRIAEKMKHKKEFKNLSASQVLQGFHSSVRFLQSEELRLNRKCYQEGKQTICKVGDNFFGLSIVRNKLVISSQDKNLKFDVVAENLTSSDFKKTSFFLYHTGAKNSDNPLISFEIFWN